MLGTGTQADPYQITTVAEFRSMNDSTAYFKLMNDLDVNDSEWASGWTEATVEFLEFDGNGHEIRNINCPSMNSNGILYSSSAARTATIKNTNFLNIVMVGRNGTFYNSGVSSTSFYVHFLNCKFSFFCNIPTNSKAYSLFGHERANVKLSECAVTITGTIGMIITSYASSAVVVLQNCAFYMDCDITYASALFGSFSYDNKRAVNVYVTGKLRFATSTPYMFSQAYTQCYVACEITSTSTVKFTSGTSATTCFYDKELAGITMEAQTNVHALTTAQCKDKDYLNSIGFLVV